MRLFYFFGVIMSCYGLYEDQIGKFDWRKQFVGCPQEVFFHKTDKFDRLIVSTNDNVIASLSATNGDLKWRRIQEDSSNTIQPMAIAGSKRLYALSDEGKTVRAWNAVTGAILWQKSVCEADSTSATLAVHTDAAQGLFVYSCEKIHFLNANGEANWEVTVGKADWAKIVITNEDVRLIALHQGTLTMKLIADGKILNSKTINIKIDNTEKCTYTGSHLVCFHSDEIVVVDVTSTSLTTFTHNTGLSIRELIVLNSNYVVVRSPSAAIVFELLSFKEIFTITKSIESATLAENHLFTVSGGAITVYDLSNGKEIFTKSLPFPLISVSRILANAQSQTLSLLVVYSDCRTELLDVSIASKTYELEWSREEGLAHVTSVEMVDLPLSESQQLIEDEFDDIKGNTLSAFIHRICSQLIQLQRWLVNTVHQMISISRNVINKGSFSDIIESVKSSSRSVSHRALERDYFNLRKMLIVTSLKGVVFGIDSSDGTIVWRTNLGANFVPLKNSFGDQKIPLFIQRSTSNYHLSGQAVIVYKDSFSDLSVLLVFNPITGDVIEKKTLGFSVNYVDLLPFVGKDHLHSLVLIDSNERIYFYPELPAEFAVNHPIFILTNTASSLSGKYINLKTRELETVWTADIHLSQDEKIVSIRGKPVSQRVHSQGRVLIDRDVQYKYSNPNLAAVATLDKVNQVLSIYLVDVVSGLIVYSSKLPRASGPVHVVHCENWIAYSYWSEKSRRTELGIIELYEGQIQSTKGNFDSLSPTSKAPEVTTQSFVYAQGIEAMAVSETEQGLTTRSIILALPFGGIHEVSRKLLDANRPQELTQEMREEGMIPYVPELPIATEDMINYNQTVFKIKGIKTSPSGLESTSLMLAYGIDIFFTRLHPSGTFDILKDDFDHVLISLVLLGLFLGSFISKRIARNNALKASWA